MFGAEPACSAPAQPRCLDPPEDFAALGPRTAMDSADWLLPKVCDELRADSGISSFRIETSTGKTIARPPKARTPVLRPPAPLDCVQASRWKPLV
ncbi:MAG TPA: hypothetical protein VMU57_06400 [Edaphobacter sp.]|uniref:hypothetical protein n=1 Tax=Edaphobacter sp. TaxID=1934404 RepID=UPI002C071370|nr:hypothetical protein [Edaphobacter sp.]HUZ94527.1 hypothetical protein [Edaphobacter sp.]